MSIEALPLIKSVPADRRWLFAAACAERSAPVFRFFCGPRSRSTFDAALALLWDVGSEITEPELERLEGLSEAKASNSSRLYATHALGVLVEALKVRAGGDSLAGCERVSMGALNVYANLDAVLRPNYPKPRVINPRNPPPPGALEVRESRLQAEHLQILSVEAQRVEDARESARKAWSELEFALVQIKKRREEAGVR